MKAVGLEGRRCSGVGRLREGRSRLRKHLGLAGMDRGVYQRLSSRTMTSVDFRSRTIRVIWSTF